MYLAAGAEGGLISGGVTAVTPIVAPKPEAGGSVASPLSSMLTTPVILAGAVLALMIIFRKKG